MADETLLTSKTHSILTIIINRAEKRNTLSADTLRSMVAAVRSAAADPEIRVLILRGAGETTFSAGYDLSLLPPVVQDFSRKMDESREVSPEENLMAAAADAFESCPLPVIAMIYGPCIGAACDLAVACDLRLASDTARFAVPAVRRGLAYPPECTRRLVNLVGVAAAKEIMLTGQFIEASRAREIGLVNRVVSTDTLAEVTYSLAAELAANGPLAMAATKQIISGYAGAARVSDNEEAGLQDLAMGCARSADFQEGVRAFLEKRLPRFQGK